MKIGFYGLGRMGSNMVARLLEKGVEVVVMNRSPEPVAEAVKLGIARALLQINPEYRPALKVAGLLTRDPRSVERKKPGKKKARKSFQFSKR